MNARRLLPLLVLLAPLPAAGGKATVPFNVGLGPAPLMVFGDVLEDQLFHGALKLRLQAVIDKETLRKNEKRIPKRYRKLALQMDEVRITPSIFIPESLIISPAVANTGMYGVTWKFINLSIPFRSDPFYFRVSAGLVASYIFIHSRTLPGPTHFLRPGVDLSAELEVKLSASFLVSLGWSSMLYVPQPVGGSILEIPGDLAALQRSIWHLGAPFFLLHYRFPVTVDL